MTCRLLGAVLLVATLTACAEEPEVPSGVANLLVPDDVDLHWDESFNGENDGLGALVPVDVMVYESGTGEPLDAVEIFLEASDQATWVLLDEDFLVVEPGLCVDCPVLWDARRDQYLALQPELAGGVAHGDLGGLEVGESAELGGPWVFYPDALEEVALAARGDLDLHRITLDTDVDGLARVYLFVDAFPWDAVEADFAAVSVLVSLGTADESFDLIPR